MEFRVRIYFPWLWGHMFLDNGSTRMRLRSLGPYEDASEEGTPGGPRRTAFQPDIRTTGQRVPPACRALEWQTPDHCAKPAAPPAPHGSEGASGMASAVVLGIKDGEAKNHFVKQHPHGSQNIYPSVRGGRRGGACGAIPSSLSSASVAAWAIVPSGRSYQPGSW